MLKLISMLATGIPAVIGGLIAFLGRKAGVAAASIASFVIITMGLILCLNAILQALLAMLVIPAWLANSIGLFIPINWSACLAAIVSSKICRAAYEMAKFKIVAINNAS
ncbi:MAG TPA: DUF5455 family protein [Noviherbaspirillum sp.]|nr:DUF5455 family protein [Noviherbaspirillum sp.]